MKNKKEIETIRLLEERLLQPSVRHSINELSEILADEFIEFGSSGRIFNKQQVIAGLQEQESTQFTISDFKAKTLTPDCILVTYCATKNETSGQKSCSLRSSIWNKTGDKWQMLFHQGTPTEATT